MHKNFFKQINNGDALKAFQELMKKQRTLLSGLLAVKGGRAVINVALKLHRLLQAKAPTKSNVKVSKNFALKIYYLAKSNDVNFVVMYLKTCAVMLQQYVAKHTVKTNSREIGSVAVSATRCGLPRIIPRVQRVLIRRGNTKAITLWLSLFNLYRYLECAYKPKDFFKTIVEENDWVPSSDISDFVPIFWAKLKKIIPKFPSLDLKVKAPQMMQSVSMDVTERMGLKGSSLFAAMTFIHNIRFVANIVMKAHVNVNAFKESGLSKKEFVSFQKLILALCNLATAWWPNLLSVLVGPLNTPKAIASFKNGVMPWPEIPGQELINKRAWMANFTRPNAQLAEIMDRVIGKLSLFLFGKRDRYIPGFGRLVKLYEAAGKVRIIAIVDPVTNWLLKPLHDWVFAILREIPNDGTFDQDKPLLALGLGRRYIGSCDMSAATDRLPVKLQALILSHIIGPKLANSWMHLLVARPYIADGKNLWYAVGQPMGALSSWAMLALTHHFMWQWAAYRCEFTGGWYKAYAVLGDDSVSENHRIVQEYLKICSELKVKVNLAKSLLSPVGCFEFAKRFITPFGNCSPISIGEILVADKNFATMSNLPRKRKIRFSDLLAIMGYRHKVTGGLEKRLYTLPKRVRNMLIVVRSPWGAFPTKSLLEWLRLDGYHRFKEKDMSSLGINVLICIDKLRTKAIQVVNSNNMSYKMSGIGGDNAKETMTQEVRSIDPQTFRVLMDLTLEPARKEIFFKAVDILVRIKDLQLQLHKEIFFLSETEVMYYWEQYIKLEEDLNAIFGGDVYLQKVEKPFVEPSPRQIVSLWNRLQQSNPNYVSKVTLPDLALLRTVERTEFDMNKEKLWSKLVNMKSIPLKITFLKERLYGLFLTKSRILWLGGTPNDFGRAKQFALEWYISFLESRTAKIAYSNERPDVSGLAYAKAIQPPYDAFKTMEEYEAWKADAWRKFPAWKTRRIQLYVKALMDALEREEAPVQENVSRVSTKKTVKQTIEEIHEYEGGRLKKIHQFPIPIWAVDDDKAAYISYVRSTGIYAWPFQKWYDFRYKYSPSPPRRKG